MSFSSLGDLAQFALLRRHSGLLKADMQRLSQELTTGQVSDTAARVSGDLTPLTGIDSSLARLRGYGAATTEAALFAGVMQTALGTLEKTASDLSVTLLSATSGSGATRIADAAKIARKGLDTAVSVLNTRVGDRSVFAGVETGAQALADSSTLLTALEVATASATTAAEVQAAVDGWFADPGGFESLCYGGGKALAPVTIGPSEATNLDVTANAGPVRDCLKGLAMAALIDRGILSGAPEEKTDLARRAADTLLHNGTDRANLAAGLGMEEARIDAAASRNAAEITGLQMARNDITGADPYETASRLQEVEGQLEKIYAVTARMSRLSLLDYL